MGHQVYKITFQKDKHLYFNEQGKEVPSVSEILRHFGIINLGYVDGVVLEKACNFGTNVHETCELYDKDDLDSCDPKIEPYLEGWKKFRKAHPFELDLIEKPLYSKVWGFAGTPDRVMCGTVIDIKSGAKAVSHALQLAFYFILVDENFPDWRVNARMAVYLKENKYKIEQFKDKTDISLAKSMLQIYGWKRKAGLL